MSWGVSLIKEGYEEIDCGNYTCNVSPMYIKAMGFSFGNLHGKLAVDVAIKLTDGIIKMTNNPKVYREMNPENDWGNYEGAIRFLAQIIRQCLIYPEYLVEVN